MTLSRLRNKTLNRNTLIPKTEEESGSEETPFDPLGFCSRGLRVGKCYSRPNLCLFNHRDQQVGQLTDYIGYDEDESPPPNTIVVESEVVRDFALTLDCSKVDYYTNRNIFQPLASDPEGEMDSFSNPLHVLTIASGEDHVILDDVDSYLLNPAGDKASSYIGRRSTGI